MYDYRQDLQTVLNSFGSQAPELTNGPAALRALANLIEQTPTKTTADASARQQKRSPRHRRLTLPQLRRTSQKRRRNQLP